MLFGLLWVLVGCCYCCATPPVTSALAPPRPANDEQPQPAADTAAAAPPEKRLLKYFLPGSNSWVDAARPTGLEGSKRGYSKNYLRFGRSDDDKRAGNRNFVRFGRGGPALLGEDDYSSSTSSDASLEKRGRNFLRFGRDRNFLRFGRSEMNEGPDDLSLEDALYLQKRGNKNYLRFGRGNEDFLGSDVVTTGLANGPMQFARGISVEEDVPMMQVKRARDLPSYVRLGRSVDSQLAQSEAAQTSGKRTKRSPNYYDYPMMAAQNPVAWGRELPTENDLDDPTLEDLQDVSKRGGYGRSFVRFGRDRNYLRFGKRQSMDGFDNSEDAAPESSRLVLVKPQSEYPRIIRAPARNFLRFG